MKTCTVCGKADSEIFGTDMHGQDLGCSGCIGVTHFPLMADAIVRHILSGHAGVVKHVAEHRSRAPYFVEFAGGAERAMAARDLMVVPSTAVCGTCKATCRTEADGFASCAPCRSRWKV